ncbi:deoxyribose-phosphate aldolase [Virgibacillus sp. CBA3643]|uniref:deoxyribose-phosphate aldolase n=1 Tax=Virgibacillus sp. CBA3643 TaxID=2942278 RepID=UPI0035A3B43F
MNKEEFCSYIDYSATAQNKTRDMLEKRCRETIEYGFSSFGSYSGDVAFIKSIVGDKAKIICPVSFPMGASTTSSKIYEALEGIDNGANELDVMMNISWFKSGLYDEVLDELKQIVEAAKKKLSDCTVKVIIETPQLKDRNELAKACELVIASGADFIKQASGYANGDGDNGEMIEPSQNVGVDNLRAMQEIVKGRIKIKASGEPKDLDECLYYIQELGVSRIGNEEIPKWLDEVGEDYWKDK